MKSDKNKTKCIEKNYCVNTVSGFGLEISVKLKHYITYQLFNFSLLQTKKKLKKLGKGFELGKLGALP